MKFTASYLASSIALLGTGCKISMKNTIEGGQYCQMCDFGLKIVIFGPFQSLPPGGKKIWPSKFGLKCL